MGLLLHHFVFGLRCALVWWLFISDAARLHLRFVHVFLCVHLIVSAIVLGIDCRCFVGLFFAWLSWLISR